VTAPRREPAVRLNHVVLATLALVAMYPLVVLVFNSVKTRQEYGANPLGPPAEVRLRNFAEAWEASGFGQTAFNSAILVIGTVVGVLTIAGLAAYSLARIRPAGSDGVMFYMLIASTLPVWLYLVPLFFMWRSLGLLNSRIGLILIYTAINAPFAVFLLRSFLLRIPPDIEEAAMVDGANRLGDFFRIVLPIAWTGFLTVGLVVALAVWGEFQIALVMVQERDLFPVTTSFNAFVSDFISRDWTLTSAVAVMMIVPVLGFFLAFQRQFVEGLTQGATKG
jgi:raffinose/stachyose/melibiose transport system permease protein